jgi:hypothetical protein
VSPHLQVKVAMPVVSVSEQKLADAQLILRPHGHRLRGIVAAYGTHTTQAPPAARGVSTEPNLSTRRAGRATCRNGLHTPEPLARPEHAAVISRCVRYSSGGSAGRARDAPTTTTAAAPVRSFPLRDCGDGNSPTVNAPWRSGSRVLGQAERTFARRE